MYIKKLWIAVLLAMLLVASLAGEAGGQGQGGCQRVEVCDRACGAFPSDSGCVQLAQWRLLPHTHLWCCALHGPGGLPRVGPCDSEEGDSVRL